MMSISVVVPSVGRPSELRACITSLFCNTVQPDEIIIVEQGSQDFAMEYRKEGYFGESPTPVHVIFSEHKSAAHARQIGAEQARGDFICFLDDDVTVASDYFKQALDFFKREPQAMGVTGVYQSHKRVSPKKLIGILFGLYSWRGINKVLGSGYTDYVRGRNLDVVTQAEFLYGCNMFVRSILFKEGFKFNTNLIRWSFTEDVEFSYKIYCKYPRGLFVLPQLNVIHHEGQQGKITNIQALRMKVIYRYLFWHGYVYGGSLVCLIQFLWAQCGFVMLEVRSWGECRELLRTYRFVWQHRSCMMDEPTRYNNFIFENRT